jgi:hypothetical protein
VNLTPSSCDPPLTHPLDWIVNGHTVSVLARIRRASPTECTQALSILDARRKAGHRVAAKIIALRRRLRHCFPSGSNRKS